MSRSSAPGTSKSRIWIILGASLIVAAGVLLLVAVLQPGSASPEPEPTEETARATTAVPASPTPSPEPSPTAAAVVATVNDYTITQEYVEKATALNEVLSEFAGEDPLGEAETLQRLVSQQLVLQSAPSEVEINSADVENYIDRMQQAWDVDEDTMASELEAHGIERAFLEDTIHRMLVIQATAQVLNQEGTDLNTWLIEQRDAADVTIVDDMSSPSPSPAGEEEPTASPVARPTATSEPQQSVIPDTAPDFTLNQAGGGTFTLTDQLEEGPVVLVFFERCG
jgi:hypothetical protein